MNKKLFVLILVVLFSKMYPPKQMTVMN